MAWFLLFFVVLPITELYVFVQSSHAIGFFSALGLLVAVTIVGTWLVKHQGLRVWRRFNEQIAKGTPPSKEIADAVLLLVAGFLLVFPGFVTDVLGILLLLPPVRALVRGGFVRRMGKRRVIRATYGGPMPGGPFTPGGGRGPDPFGVIDVASDDRDD